MSGNRRTCALCSMSCSCRVPLSICALLTSDMAAKLRQSGRRSLSECDLVQRDFRRTRDGRWRPSLDHSGSPDGYLTTPRESTCCTLRASARSLHFAAQASGDESRPVQSGFCASLTCGPQQEFACSSRPLARSAAALSRLSVLQVKHCLCVTPQPSGEGHSFWYIHLAAPHC